MANTHITKAIPAAKAAKIVEILAKVYWTETIKDEQGKEIPNVTKEVLAQKLLTEHCKAFVEHAKGLLRNIELGKIVKEDWT